MSTKEANLSRLPSAYSALAKLCGGLLLILVLLQFVVVLFRYIFDANYLLLQELALALHGMIFMLGIPVALCANRHVRIDIFSARFSGSAKRNVEVLGLLFLLLPIAGAIVITSWPYVVESWSILEGSVEVSGLPGRFFLKSLIPIMAILLVVAGAFSAMSKQ